LEAELLPNCLLFFPFKQPIKASKKAALALTALVNGTASNYMGGVSTTFMVDCKYKSNSTLPNINLTLGVNKNTANLVLKSSDYVMKVSPLLQVHMDSTSV
jgi:hypothetical protein